MTTAVAAPEPDPAPDFAAVMQAWREMCAAAAVTFSTSMAPLVEHITAWIRQAAAILADLPRCYGPAPLCIDGHGYRRRTRRRRP